MDVTRFPAASLLCLVTPMNNHSDLKIRSSAGESHNTEKVCFLTASCGYNQKIVVICRATQKICFLTISRGHFPSLSPSPCNKIFFPDYAILSSLLSKASAVEIHLCTSSNMQRAREAICSCFSGERGANKSVWKILDTNWIMNNALHYVNAVSYTLARVARVILSECDKIWQLLSLSYYILAEAVMLIHQIFDFLR